MKEVIEIALQFLKTTITINGITVSWWQIWVFSSIITILTKLIKGMFE